MGLGEMGLGEMGGHRVTVWALLPELNESDRINGFTFTFLVYPGAC